HALRRRHEGEAAFRLLAKQTEIGRRIADAEHAQAAGVGEAGANAAADETSGDDAKALGIEIAQVDDVVGHGAKIARASAAPELGSEPCRSSIAARKLHPHVVDLWRPGRGVPGRNRTE